MNKPLVASISLVILGVVLLIVCFPATGIGVERSDTRPMMGTTVTVKVRAESEFQALQAIDAAFAEAERVNTIINYYDKQSDISQLNVALQSKSQARVDMVLSAIIGRCLELSRLTDGAFDITCGSLVRLWKKCLSDGVVPPADSVATAKQQTGYQHVVVADEFISIKEMGIQFDLGAIGKGIVSDRMCEVLYQQELYGYLVEAGGDIRCWSRERPWRIGVIDPSQPKGTLLGMLPVTDGAVASSGDYEQFRIIDGRRYTHIIDPVSGQPEATIAGATVVAASGFQADGLATAFCVMPLEKSLALANSLKGVSCAIFVREGETVTLHRSRDWPAIKEIKKK